MKKDSTGRSPANRMRLRAPVILLVLAATAVPMEWQPSAAEPLSLAVTASDVLENIVGFVPIGIVLGGFGVLRATAAAALLSTFAEASQLLMVHRSPSPVDVAANTIGGILGALVFLRWRLPTPVTIKIRKWMAPAATMASLAVVLGVWASSGSAPSARGATSAGTLEARWKFDETSGRVAVDSSGQGLDGRFHNEPARVPGVRGGAVRFDGERDYIDFGHPTALRLRGSMTISAWFRAASFPVDDAAIVSSHSGLGYQLDMTADRGPRTVGFKLADSCGELMARYGATTLKLDTWYHAAGVYDAVAQTLDVYLNGKLDNGFLLGSVTGTQHSSRESVYVGRRSDGEGFEFAGAIDEVRIYSFALTKDQIVADMEGTVPASHPVRPSTDSGAGGDSGGQGAACVVLSDPEDARLPGAAATLGVLAAMACVALWPSAHTLLYAAAGLAAGLLLVPLTASTLPVFGLWMLPLVSLAGGVCVALSVDRQSPPKLKTA